MFWNFSETNLENHANTLQMAKEGAVTSACVKEWAGKHWGEVKVVCVDLALSVITPPAQELGWWLQLEARHM